MCMGKGDKCKAQKILDFLGGPVVKNLPSKSGKTGSIRDQETKSPHVSGPCTTVKEPVCCNEDPVQPKINK